MTKNTSNIESEGTVTVVNTGPKGYLYNDGTAETTVSDFIAGETGPEIGILPDGTAVMYGENGPTLYENQPLGTTIFSAKQTSKLLATKSSGGINWDHYKNNPRFLSGDNFYYPSYGQSLPKISENKNIQQVTTYDIRNVELPNVQNPEQFWRDLQEGVRRHMKDK